MHRRYLGFCVYIARVNYNGKHLCVCNDTNLVFLFLHCNSSKSDDDPILKRARISDAQ